MNINDLVYALIICLFGMAVVFVILVGLSLMTRGLGLFAGGVEKGGNKSKGKGKGGMRRNADAADPIPWNNSANNNLFLKDSLPMERQAGDYRTGDTGSPEGEELIAAMAAALAVCTEKEEHRLIVKSIRRIEDPTPVWGKIGRQEQMLNRL